jgi:hypothetical protein
MLQNVPKSNQHPGNPVPIDSARRASVDRYARLDGAIVAFKATVAEHRDLREEILGWYPDLAPEADATAPGAVFDVVVTARDNEREVTPQGMRKLSKMLGLTEFFRRCRYPLKQLPDAKDPANLYTMQERTGPRHLKPIAKLQLQAAA